MLPLRPRLDAREFVLDRVLDRLIVAQLEVQERMMLDRAPMATVERIAAEEIDRAGDPASVALGHEENDAIAHFLSDQRIE